MKCYNCGTELPDDQTVCPKCGSEQGITEKTIEDAARGSQDAMSELYMKTHNSVYAYLRFLIKDEDAVLDIMQDTYLKAFTKLDQIDAYERFGAWIKRIAHNLAIDRLRKKEAVSFSSLSGDDPDDVQFEIEDEDTGSRPEDAYGKQETAELIGDILDSLSDEQRSCVILYYYDELSVKEIAAELGLSEGTVKSRLNYGRKKVEERVRELEKKGTKLYGAAPLPFLLGLMRNAQADGYFEPPVSIKGAILEGAANSVPASAGASVELSQTAGAAAKAAAGTAVKAGGLSLGTKIAAGILVVAVAGGGIGFAVKNAGKNRPPQPPAPPSSASVEETAQTDDEEYASQEVSAQEESSQVVPEEPAASPEVPEVFDPNEYYKSVLDGYVEAIRRSIAEEDPGEFSEYSESSTIEGFIMLCKAGDDSASLDYAFVDLNGDGTDELIVAERYYWDRTSNPTVYEMSVAEVYTKGSDGPAPLLNEYKDGWYVDVLTDGRLELHQGNGGPTDIIRLRLDAGAEKLTVDEYYEPVQRDPWTNELYKIENGEHAGTVDMSNLLRETESMNIDFKELYNPKYKKIN